VVHSTGQIEGVLPPAFLAALGAVIADLLIPENLARMIIASEGVLSGLRILRSSGSTDPLEERALQAAVSAAIQLWASLKQEIEQLAQDPLNRMGSGQSFLIITATSRGGLSDDN
jgi:hypothetical protein